MANFEYIQSNAWNEKNDEDEGKRMEKKGLHVLMGNQIYYNHRVNADNIYWRCIYSKKAAHCKGSVKIDGGEAVIAQVPHNDHEPLTAKEVEVLKFKITVKDRCQTEAATTKKIYSEETKSLVAKHSLTNAEVAKLAPSYRRMASCLQKRRAKTRPRLPNAIKEIKLVDPKYTMTSGGTSKYLVFNSKNNKILLFCSPDGFACLADSTCWHGDGTFHVASKYFYQLYIIQAWFKNRMIPCAFALMHRRRAVDYVKLLKALENGASEIGKVLSPRYITTEIESAAIIAFKAVFNGIQSKGCMFHLGQNIMKRLGVLGLKQNYTDDSEFNRWINNVFALTLCPLDKIDEEFEKCLTTKPDLLRIDEFLDYFVANYFEGMFNF